VLLIHCAATEFSKYFTALSKIEDLIAVFPDESLASMPELGQALSSTNEYLGLSRTAALEREPRESFPNVVQVLRGTARVPVTFELGVTHIKITSVRDVCTHLVFV